MKYIVCSHEFDNAMLQLIVKVKHYKVLFNWYLRKQTLWRLLMEEWICNLLSCSGILLTFVQRQSPCRRRRILSTFLKNNLINIKYIKRTTNVICTMNQLVQNIKKTIHRRDLDSVKGRCNDSSRNIPCTSLIELFFVV